MLNDLHILLHSIKIRFSRNDPVVKQVQLEQPVLVVKQVQLELPVFL